VSRHRIANTRFKEEELEALVARCHASDEEAWAKLWLALAPSWRTSLGAGGSPAASRSARTSSATCDPRWSGSVTGSQRKIDQRA
jgi:hypothetical protein